jgi:hypothetical protein
MRPIPTTYSRLQGFRVTMAREPLYRCKHCKSPITPEINFNPSGGLMRSCPICRRSLDTWVQKHVMTWLGTAILAAVALAVALYFLLVIDR